MSWSAIAALSDILGAIGVIVSLVYLAIQVRNNSQELIENRTQQVYEMMIATRSDIANGPLGSIMTKVQHKQPLSAEEQLRYQSHLARLFNLWEIYYFNLQKGKIDPRLATVMRDRLSMILSNPLAQAYWQQNTAYYSQPFQHYVAEILH
jgi:hypothetical protein